MQGATQSALHKDKTLNSKKWKWEKQTSKKVELKPRTVKIKTLKHTIGTQKDSQFSFICINLHICTSDAMKSKRCIRFFKGWKGRGTRKPNKLLNIVICWFIRCRMMRFYICKCVWLLMNPVLKASVTSTWSKNRLELVSVTVPHSYSHHVQMFAAVYISINSMTSMSLQTAADVSCKRRSIHYTDINIQLCK